MNIAVRYFTRSGNTEKLAKAVAQALGTQAFDLSTPLGEKADLLFLGNSLYANNPDPQVIAFLEQNAEMIDTLVNFGSSASRRSTLRKIRAAAEKKGITVLSEEFICPGSFLFLHKGRPNEQDLREAAEFAKRIAGEL